jgi:hypothetical protein
VLLHTIEDPILYNSVYNAYFFTLTRTLKLTPAHLTGNASLKRPGECSFTIEDLQTKFKHYAVVSALQCAGNRQEEVRHLFTIHFTPCYTHHVQCREICTYSSPFALRRDTLTHTVTASSVIVLLSLWHCKLTL